jgi:CBS domain containing-hemolysin-like protein
MRLLRPVIVVLNGAANVLVRAVGVEVVDERELGHSAEELLLVLGQARESGVDRRSARPACSQPCSSCGTSSPDRR